MSQNAVDFPSSDPSGSNLLDTLLNNEQSDRMSSNSGTARPSNAVAGTFWVDTTTNPWVLKLFNGTDDIPLGNADIGTLKFVQSGATNLLTDLTPQLGGFLDPNSKYIGRAKGADIASASPLVIGTDGDMFDVTGTTGFSLMTVASNRNFVLQFDAALTITHGSGITLPGAANFTTAAGDVITCQSTATNTVLVTGITKADGTSVTGAGSMVLLQTQTASASANIEFIDGVDGAVLDGTYDNYIIEGTGITASTAVSLLARMYLGGSLITTSTYSYGNSKLGSGNTNNSYYSNNGVSQAYYRISPTSTATSATLPTSVSLMIPAPSSTASYKMLRAFFLQASGSTSVQDGHSSGICSSSTAALTGIQLYLDTGTITTGTFKLYGVL